MPKNNKILTMDNSIKIGKYIKLILSADKELLKMVPLNKICALKADEGTTYPFIVYSRTSISPQYTKDIGGELGHIDTVQVTVDCHGRTYEESAEVANEFRNALEGYGYQNNEIYIDRFRLVSSYETTNGEGDWTQIMVFQTTTQSRTSLH